MAVHYADHQGLLELVIYDPHGSRLPRHGYLGALQLQRNRRHVDSRRPALLAGSFNRLLKWELMRTKGYY